MFPGLPRWPPALEQSQDILQEFQLCQEILGALQPLQGKLPEARAIPVISLFPTLPPIPNHPNVLLCLVENVFPPALAVTWTVAGASVTQGVTLGPLVATSDLTFARLATLAIVPRPGTVYACQVTAAGNVSTVAYWVAPDTALDEQLQMALAGAALALGLVLVLLGLGLALLARRNRNG